MDEEKKCENPDCVKHTPVVHNQCILKGKNKCQDNLHNRECWTKDQCERMSKILDNY